MRMFSGWDSKMEWRTPLHTKWKVVIQVVIELSSIDNGKVVRVVPVMASFFFFLVVKLDNMDNFENDNPKVITIVWKPRVFKQFSFSLWKINSENEKKMENKNQKLKWLLFERSGLPYYWQLNLQLFDNFVFCVCVAGVKIQSKLQSCSAKSQYMPKFQTNTHPQKVYFFLIRATPSFFHM